MKNQLSILFVDDHSLYIKGLKVLIEQSYPNCSVYSFTSTIDLMKSVTNFDKYDLLISDMHIPKENTLSFLSQVRSLSNIPILVISMHNKIAVINQCKKIGVNGYILKNDDEYLISAISKLIGGENFFSPKVNTKLKSSIAQNIVISNREKEVIKLICDGYSNLKIGELLFISIETVKTHKKNIRTKLGLKSNHEIIEFARNNIII